jgi:RHS repeat-associated protein
MRTLVRFAIWIGFLFFVSAQPVWAQDQEPTPMWYTVGSFTYHGSPEEACQSQMTAYSGSGLLSPEYNSWHNYKCRWERGPIGPTNVTLKCFPQGTLLSPGKCVSPNRDQDPNCDPCSDTHGPSASPVPQKGNPVDLASNSKVLVETDYESADGLLRVERNYSSKQSIWASLSDLETKTFGARTQGLIPGILVLGGNSMQYAEFATERGVRGRFAVPNGTTDLTSYNYQTEGQSRFRLAMVTADAGNRYDVLRTGNADFKVALPSGQYLLYRTTGTYDTNAQERFAIPVEHGYPGGYKRYFDYSPDKMHPDRVRDSHGRILQLTWEKSRYPGVAIATTTGTIIITSTGPAKTDTNTITGIGLPDGTRLSYVYDRAPSRPKDRLREVKRLSADGTVLWSRSYLFEDANRPLNLTGTMDQNGQRLSTYSYNYNAATGVTTTTTELAGTVNKHVIEKIPDPGAPWGRFNSKVTGPLGLVENHTFQGLGGGAQLFSRLKLESRKVEANGSIPETIRSYEYLDSSNEVHVSGMRDNKGNYTKYTLERGMGRPTAITEAQGNAAARTTNIVWHPVFDLPLEQSLAGRKMSYTYDTSGQILTQTVSDTTTHTVPYSTNGQARTISYAWTPTGRLASINGPLAVNAAGKDDAETYTYDTSGNLLTATNGLGHVTTYGAYDANGRPGTMTDANGAVTAFTYDPLGRVLTINRKHPTVATSDAITTMTYDVEGRVTGVTLPATDKMTITYDLAGRATSVSAASGERIDYTYDGASNVLSQTVKRSNGTTARQITRTFDALSRMLTETLGPNRTTAWEYDKNDNPVKVISARSNATTAAFDALDRLTETVAPDTGIVRQTLDAHDDAVAHKDAADVTTNFVRNGFGEVIQEVSPDRGTSRYTYDAAGQVLTATDGRGQVVTYTYDVLGRVLTKTPTGLTAQKITYTYDAGGLGSYQKGRLAKIVDASGTTLFNYDHRGNMLTKRQVVGTTTAANLTYAYDLADRVTQITYPSGRIVGYVRDTKGRVATVRTKATSAVTSWTNVATGLQYEAFGSLKQLTYGNSLSLTQNWGNDGRLAEKRVYKTSGGANVSRLTYAYDNDDNMVGITDAVDATRSVEYQYDSMGRLMRADANASATSVALKRTDWVHDKNGNRTRVERRANAADAAAAETDSYATTTGANRLASVTTATGVRSITYDARGNTVSETRPNAVGVTAAYDGFGRLTSYARTGEASLAHVYNGMDQRVSMTRTASGGSDTRRFVYDRMGRVLGEYGASATDVKAEFIWLHPDNDNTPFGGDDGVGGYAPLAIAVADTATTTKLHWVHGSQMGVPLATTDATGAVVTSTGYETTMFPGQSRTLADLYYNMYRDYDPTTGRYIQADPIGLAGDPNPYAYALNNPVSNTDPEGLNAVTAGRLAWGAGGLAGRGLLYWCRANPATCAATIAPPAIWVSKTIKRFCKDDENERAQKCEANLERDMATCRALGKRSGKGAFRVCEQQAMLRYGNCLAGRDGPGKINAPLPQWSRR